MTQNRYLDDEERAEYFMRETERLDFLDASSSQLMYLVPILQVPLALWHENFEFELESDELTPYLGIIRLVTSLQALLVIYLAYFSFYSSKGSCWDKFGIYVHFTACMLVFFLIPVFVLVIDAICLPEVPDSPYAAVLLSTGIISLLTILTSLVYIRPIMMGALSWHRCRYDKISGPIQTDKTI